MKKTIWDLIKLMLPLGKEKRHALSIASKYISLDDTKTLKYFLKLDRAFALQQKFHTTPTFFEDMEWVIFKSHRKEQEVDSFVERISLEITQKAQHEAFLLFSPYALTRLTACVAPNIIGMEEAKQASALQLFAKEPVNILLIGDPGTGKTDILRSIHTLSPISSFGLGSGTSGVGLSAVAKGDTIIKGLLPLADNGIACIDELNLMKAKDTASLYNAMEKGFVTYDKGGRHEQLPARVRVCATANPSGDTFVGRSAEVLKKQIPFDDALTSRFHLIFVIRKPSAEEFAKITAKIVADDKGKTMPSQDLAFAKAYISYALTLDITLDPALELEVVTFIKKLKEEERQFLVEIGPRTVTGVVRMIKAVARAELASSVSKTHIKTATRLVEKALYVRRNDDA